MEPINISEVLLPEMTILDQETFADKDEFFRFISQKFFENNIVSDADKFTAALHAREEIGSTYVGDFLAMPHGICDEVIKPGVGFCRVKTPFLYRSNDEEGEVKYIFTMAIAGEDGAVTHLRIITELAKLLAHEEFLEKLGTVQSYDELLDAVHEVQQSLS